MNPVDLEATYPGFRVFMSEDHESGQHRDSWNFELRNVGGRGMVWPYSDTDLAAYTDRRVLGMRLRRIPGIIPQQLGDTETVVRFRPGTTQAAEVFAILTALASIRPPVGGQQTAPNGDGAENPGDTASEAPGAAIPGAAIEVCGVGGGGA